MLREEQSLSRVKNQEGGFPWFPEQWPSVNPIPWGTLSPRPPGIYRFGAKVEVGGGFSATRLRPRPGAGAQVASQQSLILLSG